MALGEESSSTIVVCDELLTCCLAPCELTLLHPPFTAIVVVNWVSALSSHNL
jgi:hypothetical protein